MKGRHVTPEAKVGYGLNSKAIGVAWQNIPNDKHQGTTRLRRKKVAKVAMEGNYNYAARDHHFLLWVIGYILRARRYRCPSPPLPAQPTASSILCRSGLPAKYGLSNREHLIPLGIWIKDEMSPGASTNCSLARRSLNALSNASRRSSGLYLLSRGTRPPIPRSFQSPRGAGGPVRRMPTDFPEMDPSSGPGNTLAELLRNLGTKLTQGASSIGQVRILVSISHTDARPTISHAPSLSEVRRPSYPRSFFRTHPNLFR